MTAILVQARMGATRLPGKPLFKVMAKPLLGYLIERLKRVSRAEEVAIITTTSRQDDQIAHAAEKYGAEVFRGSEDNVLERYTLAARHFNARTVVRVTADCPLIDPLVIDRVIDLYQSGGYDYTSNTLSRTYPRGMDVEVFSKEVLEEVFAKASQPHEKEHVTPYIYQNPHHFRIIQEAYQRDISQWRWTVDTREDFVVISYLLGSAYPKNRNFTLEDLIKIADDHPNWMAINSNVVQKPLIS